MADTDTRTVGKVPRPGTAAWCGRLIVLAAVIALVSSLTVWVKRQALDTDS